MALANSSASLSAWPMFPASLDPFGPHAQPTLSGGIDGRSAQLQQLPCRARTPLGEPTPTLFVGCSSSLAHRHRLLGLSWWR